MITTPIDPKEVKHMVNTLQSFELQYQIEYTTNNPGAIRAALIAYLYHQVTFLPHTNKTKMFICWRHRTTYFAVGVFSNLLLLIFGFFEAPG